MLISDEYRDQCERLHALKPSWGSYAGNKHASRVLRMAREWGCGRLLDYGAGKGTLFDGVSKMCTIEQVCSPRIATLGPEFTFQNFDPATWPDQPSPADLVCCLDVLEHIEPDCLDAVLVDLASLTRKVCFVVISTRKAGALLPDGRNAHLIVQNSEWWIAKLQAVFDVVECETHADEVHALLRPISIER